MPDRRKKKSNAASGVASGVKSTPAAQADAKAVPDALTALPQHEFNLFKRMVKCNDQQQFKQGLKISNQILANPRCANHVDTLATKSQILLGLGKIEEAEATARAGLKLNLRSFECWYALYQSQRDLKKYQEATKCLRNCLKLKPDNLDILRNLSVITVHAGDYEGYREARMAIFQQKPTQRASWGGLAIGYHLEGDYDMCIKTLDEYLMSQEDVNRQMVGDLISSIMNKRTDYDFEHSEFFKYHISVLKEAKKYEQALALLQTKGSSILDKDFALDTESALLLLLGREEEASDVMMKILRRNPCRTDILERLIKSNKLTSMSAITNFCADKNLTKMSSDCMSIIALKYAEDEHFRLLSKKYFDKCLTKGIPAAIKNIESAYASSEKTKLVWQVIGSLVSESPESLWVNYYAAQHCFTIGDYEKALEYLQLCTEPELEHLLLKGKIFKLQGDLTAAVQEVSKAFELDKTDRWMGSKLTKYLLRAGQIKEAVKVMGQFTKPGSGNKLNLVSTRYSKSFNNLYCLYISNSEFES